MVEFDKILEEEKKISDTFFDKAYDSITPQKRGIIKKAIALNYKWNILRFNGGRRIHREWHIQGCVFGEEKIRHSLFALFLSPEVDSPSQIISLILPPKIAGIENILVFGVHTDKDWSLPIILALELLGVDRVYSIDESEVSFVSKQISERGGILWALVSPSYQSHPLWGVSFNEIFFTPSRGAIIYRDRARFNIEEISFSHPSLFLEERDSVIEDEFFNVVYSTENFPSLTKLKKELLILGPGCESLWLWPYSRFSSLFYSINWAY